ncbi:hypothetical protein [Thalassotalea sp. PLHSN55]|uniref:hypothetical protein n=1 Tax=Thalassotalea sp. PLHSN55 TaxID=3435888 RepID=UPI003F84363C
MCLFTLLFVGQTIAATFDEHRVHQELETHASLANDHQHQQQSAQIKKQHDTSQESFNCHECGHCHTPTNVFTLASASHVNLTKNSTDSRLSPLFLASVYLSPDHRPPIT